MKDKLSFKFEHPLKSITTTQLEQAIAKVLSDLTGQEYNARVEKIDYNPETNSAYQGKATLSVHVEKPFMSALETTSDRIETTEAD